MRGTHDHQCRQQHQQRGSDHDRHAQVDEHVEDEDHDPGREQRQQAERHGHERVRRLDQPALHPPPRQLPMDGHRAEHHGGHQRGQDHEDEVEPLLAGAQVREALLERQREQEARGQLGAGLDDAQLLEQVVVLAVLALGLALVALLVGSFRILVHGALLVARYPASTAERPVTLRKGRGVLGSSDRPWVEDSVHSARRFPVAAHRTPTQRGETSRVLRSRVGYLRGTASEGEP